MFGMNSKGAAAQINAEGLHQVNRGHIEENPLFMSSYRSRLMYITHSPCIKHTLRPKAKNQRVICQLKWRVPHVSFSISIHAFLMVYIQFIILNFVNIFNKYCIKLTIAYTCICSPQIALHYSKLALAYKSHICHLDSYIRSPFCKKISTEL